MLSQEKSALTSNTMLLGILSMVIQAIKIYRKNDASVVEKMIARNRALIRAVEQRAANVSGDDLFELILQGNRELKKATSDGMALMVVGGYVSQWLNKKMQKWLGEKNVAELSLNPCPTMSHPTWGLTCWTIAVFACMDARYLY
ncbi:phosphoenolpyruvate synthase [Pelotomaculum sp. FP]|nr:phosphoenolpyruvate synthase [Pelotomaculum sp. FP]